MNDVRFGIAIARSGQSARPTAINQFGDTRAPTSISRLQAPSAKSFGGCTIEYNSVFNALYVLLRRPSAKV